ncbi:class I SAM-dependent methyltransferase [Crossiella sp. CA-258035]|uniref:class I SAM-dependent methyltransferase n=1 Tax=Crossiella sp. CA-258035 TaxID=2981138 RepID=UPI0024BCDEFE|nr:class I SAM-dependent methyltransferase [Crossiella sp. CA-258035]WHT17028.1 class I SAM-dependent methyltransferase [Crossiella sp. CA-258035]
MDRRAEYAAELAEGLARFFQPRRATCPWCGSTRITLLLRSPDLVQRKPGRFQLDRCADCAHVFQNPCLSAAGLAFYYRDFYDGLGERMMDVTFSVQARTYRERAALVVPHADPASWLDVGCGHGHFCRTARKVLPRTSFDGLDFGGGVELARDRGWIRRGYRGEFPALAAELAERYDVVSMHHYLEHSTDPRRELVAALKVLRPGGLLLVEVPDPESAWARLTGRYWIGWLQPQHLHFAPRANLRAALTELGFTVLSESTDDPAHSHGLPTAMMQISGELVPPPERPWLPRPTRTRRLARALGLLVSVPLIALAVVAGWLLGPLARRYRLHHNYRLVARKS